MSARKQIKTHGFAPSVYKNACARAPASSYEKDCFLLDIFRRFGQGGPSRRTSKSFERPCARAGGALPVSNSTGGQLSRVGRARMSNSLRNLYHRREGAVIVAGVISIGAITGLAVV
eukprot:5759787-Pyramimonas_sp.AAC.1